MFKKIQALQKVAKTVSSPITHAKNIIKSTFKKKTNQSKISPDIKQPRQLKKTMKNIRSQYEKFGFTKAKTAKDRANIVRTKKSIERMDKLDRLKQKRQEGIKASKEVKKMIGTNQADRVGSSVYSRHVPDKKAKGGRIGFKLGKKVEKKKGKKFPDLTGDGKVTFADVLKGRGVINGKKKKKKVI